MAQHDILVPFLLPSTLTQHPPALHNWPEFLISDTQPRGLLRLPGLHQLPLRLPPDSLPVRRSPSEQPEANR